MSRAVSFRYRVVDVFTTCSFEGNQLAVFPDASGIDDANMQKIARELNLSETVFVLPATRPDCAVRLRIFTPGRELIFAGHPTVGASFVLLEEGMLPRDSEHFALEEGVGPVPVWIERDERPMIWFRTPAISDGKRYDAGVCAQLLGLDPADLLDIPPQLLNAGNPTVLIALKSKEAVDRAWLDSRGVKTLMGEDREPFCVFVFTPTKEGAYSRMFAPEYGVSEDPATGSSTGPLAAFMMRHGLVSPTSGTRFFSEQGKKMGRRSILHVKIIGDHGKDGIDVGGHVTPIAEGVMTLGSRFARKEAM
jgi:trans-2,3-dihydro-3-hydroxyanthranilate isomerase